MNTNPVTEKQVDFINTLKQQSDGKTNFLSGVVSTYNRINQRQGYLPETIAEDIQIGDLSINERVIIPERGSLTPADVIEMKKSFDTYITQYVPETTTNASTVIDILKGNKYSATVKFIFTWLSQNYTITSKLITEGYCKGMTKYFINK